MSVIETDPSLALQGAMVDRLKADAALEALNLGDRVFDRVEQNTAFPFIKIGEDVVAPLDSECGSDTEIISTVRVYSRKPGRVECKRFAERLRFLLTKQSGFTIAGYRVVLGYCEGYRIEEHTDGLTHQAIMEFRYRIEPVDLGVAVNAPANAAGSVGTPTRTVLVSGSASALAIIGIPTRAVLMSGAAEASGNVGTPTRTVLISAPAEAAGETGSPESISGINAPAEASGSVGTPTRTVLVSGAANAVGEAGTPTRTALVSGAAEASGAVGTPTRTVLISGAAEAAGEVGAGIEAGSDWILGSGIWDDDALWDDDATWDDGE